ncbi:double-strand break repair helicase AddA [Parvularcula bermudensis]|nr:double-strand break repair helicase AddA [Parvularcula bermudensis]
MTNSALDPLAETTAIQQTVSDPRRSAWLSANAGSGKTHVLIGRVIRLLTDLADGGREIDPSSILCLTFTNAAAAEMKNRLFDILGEWSLLSDEALSDALTTRFGRSPAAPSLMRTRRLFARALDTPGGLRVQTIHAFCESLLRQFPLEAGVMPGFSVLDDAEYAALIHRCRWQALRALQAEGFAGDHLTVQEKFSQESAVMKALAGIEASDLMPTEDLIEQLGEGGDSDVDDIKRHCLQTLDREFVRQFSRIAPDIAKGAKERTFRAREALSAWEADDPSAFDHLCSAFLKADGQRPADKTMAGNKDIRGILPSVAAEWAELATALEAARHRITACAIIRTHAATERLLRRTTDFCRAEKARRGLLDYDDLVASAASLLTRTDHAWLQFKLSHGLHHLLVDETQDTGPSQWSVLNPLRQALLAHNGEVPKTVFFVGDRKQSIYAFQGADADLFERERAETETLASRDHFVSRQLFLSFRSSQAILDVVDESFTPEEARRGLSDDAPIRHVAAKPDLPGKVELWPLERRDETLTEDPWSAPVDAVRPEHPTRKLAKRLAADIKKRVGRDDCILKNGDKRPLAYRDILLLCQTRGPIFHEVLRALSEAAIPTAGADRLPLMEDIAVRDLLSALRFAVNHEDDLSLAELLKSPLVGIDDDLLFALAHGRDQGVTLWSRVREAAGSDDRLAAAVAMIEEAEGTGHASGPFALLSSYLDGGQPSGWLRFHRRLGLGVDLALEELLTDAIAFEQAEPRSLVGFVHYLERSLSDGRIIKRDSEDTEDVVRVMTVHGAKGREAHTVYLIDANKPSELKADFIKGDGGKLICPPSGVSHPLLDLAKEKAKAREREEYRRRLYVGMTRAEQRLVITGTAGTSKDDPEAVAEAKPPAEASWYGLVAQAMTRLGERVERQSSPGEAPLRVLSVASSRDRRVQPDKARQSAASAIPNWLFRAADREVEERTLAPSHAVDQDQGRSISTIGPLAMVEGQGARRRGILLHGLFERLPPLAPAQRRPLGARYLACHGGDIPAEERARWLEEVLGILENEAFAEVFSPAAKTEMAIAGRLGNRRISGQIDRLVLREEEVVFVDFKTHRPPPRRVEDVESATLSQMALYHMLLRQRFPGRRVTGALLWTYTAQLMPLPEAVLLSALEKAL